ncbi:MAG: hypothetical protein J6W54_06895 [Fibrobacter sp.]|uniref:hypothetical protein n=1 Tax=Fibrobacter sp. TaxID=35828 RepID=UPI001B2BE9A9|nr:hypothetical protein [Fibrobacter sp.]MBO7060804.1 hypothetical protein [Fibrobacter sp.]
MNIAYKMIVAGMAAFWVSCSNDSSVDQGVGGATTEPNTSPVAELNEEQKVLLAKSFYTLLDSSGYDSLKALPDSGLDEIDYKYFRSRPFGITNDQVFSYPSRDGRKICDVVSFTRESQVERKGVLRAMSYDVYDHTCHGVYGRASSELYRDSIYCAMDYTSNHVDETMVTSKIVDVDGVPVVMNTVSGDYWGYGVSCTEFLNQFKQSCIESNGLFKLFGDACSWNILQMACASFVPEGKSPDDVLNSYTEEYKAQCHEDSLNYVPYDDENYVAPHLDSLAIDSLKSLYFLQVDWRQNLKRTLLAYRWQFSMSKATYVENVAADTIGISGDDVVEMDGSAYHFVEFGVPEYIDFDIMAYNTLPSGQIADAYRKEGVYVLPDSLVAEFFPQTVGVPAGMDWLKWKSNVFYIIVIKDVGVKGHILTNITVDEIQVTDLVRSGQSCPEDTSVNYSMFLLSDSPEWGIVGRPIVKTTYVSENWNCDKPESLERIDPYGEWTYVGKEEFDYELYLWDWLDSRYGRL